MSRPLVLLISLSCAATLCLIAWWLWHEKKQLEIHRSLRQRLRRKHAQPPNDEATAFIEMPGVERDDATRALDYEELGFRPATVAEATELIPAGNLLRMQAALRRPPAPPPVASSQDLRSNTPSRE